MATRAWRLIGKGRVPQRDGVAWTQIVESVTPGRLIKIEVPRTEGDPPVDQIWVPDNTKDIQPAGCSADGTHLTGTSVVLPGVPMGCLIGRIGGSTVDMAADGPTVIPPMRILFSIGRFCVFAVPTAFPGGGLFLGANDIPDKMNAVTNALTVDVYEAL